MKRYGASIFLGIVFICSGCSQAGRSSQGILFHPKFQAELIQTQHQVSVSMANTSSSTIQFQFPNTPFTIYYTFLDENENVVASHKSGVLMAFQSVDLKADTIQVLEQLDIPNMQSITKVDISIPYYLDKQLYFSEFELSI